MHVIAGKEQIQKERNGEVKLGFRWNKVDKSRFRFQRYTYIIYIIQYIIPIYISTQIYVYGICSRCRGQRDYKIKFFDLVIYIAIKLYL